MMLFLPARCSQAGNQIPRKKNSSHHLSNSTTTYIQPNLFPSYAQPALVLVNMRVFGFRLTVLGRLSRFFLLRLGRLLTQFATGFARLLQALQLVGRQLRQTTNQTYE